MAGSVQYLDRDVSQFDDVAVADFVEWEVYIRVSEQYVLRARSLCQFAAYGHMIGMQMSVYNGVNVHPGFLGPCAGRALSAERVNNGSYCLASTSKHVGCCDRVGMQELTQNHGFLPVEETYIQLFD